MSTPRVIKRDYLTEVVGEEDATAAESVAHGLVIPATQTAAALLTESADDLRHRARTLTVAVDETHQRTYEHEWRVLAQQRGAQAPSELLDQLGDWGFAWRDVGRLIGVSVPAVNKWRRGERITGSNRSKLAQLVAACDFLISHFYVDEVVSWFEMPLHESAPITALDLWASGTSRLFFDYATHHIDAEDALTKLDPEWRDRYRSNYETFRDADGTVGIRSRG